MSLMSGKALPCGEGGILITNDREIYEKAVAFGHYGRTGQELTIPELKQFAGLPLGGYKYRMHQISSAVARVQLRHYRERMEEIQAAMNYFWDLLEDVPGIRAHRPPEGSNSTMGGWYAAHGIYVPEELDGLDIGKFCEAVRAEGARTTPGANLLLHLHPVLNEADIYAHGKPTRIANSQRDLRQLEGSLPVTESIPSRTYSIPWFKHYRPRIIEEHALAFRKVAENADQLSVAY
jgi:perosamine synthetase